MSFNDYTTDYPYDIEQSLLIINSYKQFTGKVLIEEGGDDKTTAENLFQAPFAVLSHNTAQDPVFNYANLAALTLFEYTWEQLSGVPSRLSAEPVNREERQRLLDEVTKNGFISNYSGIRIARTGKRFKIRNAVIWNILDNQHCYHGQAALIKEWSLL